MLFALEWTAVLCAQVMRNRTLYCFTNHLKREFGKLKQERGKLNKEFLEDGWFWFYLFILLLLGLLLLLLLSGSGFISSYCYC